jgi:hypothetical protein
MPLMASGGPLPIWQDHAANIGTLIRFRPPMGRRSAAAE